MQTIYFGIVTFLGIHLLILVHELGHYMAAKHFNLATPRFVVGLGPTILSWIRGETLFEWRLIPVFGFVEILGIAGLNGQDIQALQRQEQVTLGLRDEVLARPSPEAISTELLKSRVELVEALSKKLANEQFALASSRHYYSLTWWRQIVVILAGPVMNFALVLALLALSMAIEAIGPSQFEGHMIAARSSLTPKGLIEPGDHLFILTRLNDEKALLSRGAALRIRRFRDGNGTDLPVDEQTFAAINQSVIRTADVVSICRDRAFALAWGSGLISCLPGIDAFIDTKLNDYQKWLQSGIHSSFLILAATSLGMGLFNLIPFPPLDGGRVAFSVLKGLGLPVPDKVAWNISVAGSILLFLFLAFNWISSALLWLSSLRH